jgi:hypothetical protein
METKTPIAIGVFAKPQENYRFNWFSSSMSL